LGGVLEYFDYPPWAWGGANPNMKVVELSHFTGGGRLFTL